METTENTPQTDAVDSVGVNFDFTVFFAEEEIAALRSKIKPEDRKKYLASTPGNEDVVIAYIVHKAIAEAKDKIFSDKRNGLVFDLLKHQLGLIHADARVSDVAHEAIVAIAQGVEPKQAQTLAGLVRKENLAGKTGMTGKVLEAFQMLCEILGVDTESLK